ncbi:protein NO VEIN domain-containing protein [Lysinibacillus capsici]|uniref:protein NO VEIN domain-containing protein n=1 Tax=Lysinibacillus capsici TaxID=2115968 RepID=UPI00279BE244|nr:DUF3883 domain-containing protein [Lysinibacillus boronitolerans]
MYKVPDQFYFRLHHPRPRFKSNIENVLIYMASEIVQIGSKPKAEFKQRLNDSIRMFPGNLNSTQKTIDNWRTEIDALFALIQENDQNLEPTYRAVDLAENQDLVKFFKVFCYYFQYPGGFVKNHVNLELINARINFKPAQYILTMLFEAEQKYGIRAGVTKAEVTHCIFNDLRVTRDHRPPLDTWDLISSHGVEYDWTGDVIRYAGDFLDYLVQANLLIRRPNQKYYLNKAEGAAIQRFIKPYENDFNYYNKIESLIREIDGNAFSEDEIKRLMLSKITDLENEWIRYFNTPLSDEFFDTDVISLVTSESTNDSTDTIDLSVILEEIADYSTGNIGSVGEAIIVKHEVKRLELGGRLDLKHLVKFIPTHFAMGYDISSRELDGGIRNIEVKTTTSSREIHFTRFHLTPNEWAVAESYQDRYYVYRLMISKESIKLYILQNPVRLYKEDRIKALPRDGMDVTFDSKSSGFVEELLV